MRTAIFGGTFNPPHQGHLQAAQAAVQGLQLDQLLLMPNHIPPHKALPENSATPEQRLELCRLAAQQIPRCQVCDLELRQPGPSYTADTVERYHAAHPEETLWLLVGTDMLLSFDQWREPQRILACARLAVAARDEAHRRQITDKAEWLRVHLGARVDVLDNPALPVSSTQLRTGFDGKLLPPAVADYIRSHRLYRPSPAALRQRVQGLVSEKRFRHILGCEAQATEMAARFGADVETVGYAAILHDMTKEFPLDMQLQFAKQWNIIFDYEKEDLAPLIHADTAAAMAREELGMWDGVVRAIARHAAGAPGMTREELILYVADLCEPTRNYPGVEALRAAARTDLRQAGILGMERTMAFVRSQGREPYYKTALALETLKNIGLEDER